jgi:hypothetical protein
MAENDGAEGCADGWREEKVIKTIVDNGNWEEESHQQLMMMIREDLIGKNNTLCG